MVNNKWKARGIVLLFVLTTFLFLEFFRIVSIRDYKLILNSRYFLQQPNQRAAGNNEKGNYYLFEVWGEARVLPGLEEVHDSVYQGIETIVLDPSNDCVDSKFQYHFKEWAYKYASEYNRMTLHYIHNNWGSYLNSPSPK